MITRYALIGVDILLFVLFLFLFRADWGMLIDALKTLIFVLTAFFSLSYFLFRDSVIISNLINLLENIPEFGKTIFCTILVIATDIVFTVTEGPLLSLYTTYFTLSFGLLFCFIISAGSIFTFVYGCILYIAMSIILHVVCDKLIIN